MAVLTELTPQAAIELAAVAQEWAQVAWATGPAERARAEDGVRTAYLTAGLPVPQRIVWVQSPVQGAVAGALLAGGDDALRVLRTTRLGAIADPLRERLPPAGRCVRDLVRTRPWEQARAAASAGLRPHEWARAWALTGGRLWDPVQSMVTRIRRGIAETAVPADGGEIDQAAAALVRGATLDAVLGQHDAPWLAALTGLGEGASLRGLAEVARSAGWWWPYEKVTVVCERPAALHRDENGRLHRGDGPALAYPDTFALHAWRGMPVPADVIGTLSSLTAERIGGEANAELRRVMLEHYGYDRFLRESGAQPLHRDETGVLWCIDLPGDEPVVMVEVVNSTPEPDGASRTYWLRVPPQTRTAREGVAWTFGVDAAAYRPQRQT